MTFITVIEFLCGKKMVDRADGSPDVKKVVSSAIASLL